jgi:hypothetical protein
MSTIAAALPSLPPEVVDAIIDELQSSPYLYQRTPDYYEWKAQAAERVQLLGACSLVSKSWLPRSRYFLFMGVFLCNLPLDRAMAFLDLLDSPHSTISPYVRTLTLEEAQSTWLNAVLPRCTALHSVEALNITNGCFHLQRPPTEDVASFFASLRKLRMLSLTRCTFATYAQLHEALHSIPSLEYLLLSDNFVMNHSETDAVSTAPPPFALKYLSISPIDGKGGMIEWLALSGQEIPKISLGSIESKDSGAIAHFLLALGPFLKSLVLEFTPRRFTADAQGVPMGLT